MPIHLTVDTDQPISEQVLQQLRTEGISVTAPPSAPCAVCGGVFAESALVHKPALGGLACEVCRGISHRIYEEFKGAAQRQWTEIQRQLPREVRAIRAGAPFPTFYRGFE